MIRRGTRDLNLDGRTVLITGAGSGIGAGIAAVAAARGATVAVNDRDAATAEATVVQLVEAGGTALAVPGDVTDGDTARAIVETVVETTGGLDGLVNNAGITGPARFEDIEPDDWDRVLDLNLATPFRLSRLVVPHLRHSGSGRIVNIASIAGTRVSVLGGAAYTASKSGLIGLTRHLAMELARDGITVNALLPGVTVTPLVRAATEPEQLERIGRSVPIGRAGTPEDVGSATAFLLGEASGYISGTAIEIDGALTALPGNFTAYEAIRQAEVAS